MSSGRAGYGGGWLAGWEEHTILHVESDEFERRLVEEALRELDGRIRVVGVSDGESALAQLRRADPKLDGHPSVVMMSFGLPSDGGRELLQELKGDPTLQSLPVIVLAAGTSAEDVQAAYSLRANCCILKPRDVAELGDVLRATVEFWTRRVMLPSRAQWAAV